MNDQIKVKVNHYGPRRNLVLRWTDPVTGARRTKSAGTEDPKAAERMAGELEKELRSGRYAPPSKTTWEDFTLRYVEEVLPGMKKSSQSKVFSVFNCVERVLHPRRLVDITVPALSRMQSQLRCEKRSDETIKGYFGYLRPALAWAVDMGLLVQLPKFPKQGKTKRASMMKGRPITGEEFDRLLAAVPNVVGPDVAPVWRHLLAGLWLSGLRLGEALDLHWDRPDRLSVDLTGRRPMLSIPGELEKGGRDRLLPITPDFTEFLLDTSEDDQRGRVFQPQYRHGRRSAPTLNSVSGTIVKIGKRAGIKAYTHPVTGKVKYASAHDLRRSFGARWAMRVMPQVLKELMRHESIETTLRYYVGVNAERTADVVWEAWEARGNTFGNIGREMAENSRET